MSVASTEGFWPTLSAIGLGIIGVATLALVVSKNSNTTGVISATGDSYSNALAVALSPVTGGSNGSAYSNMSAGSQFPIT